MDSGTVEIGYWPVAKLFGTLFGKDAGKIAGVLSVFALSGWLHHQGPSLPPSFLSSPPYQFYTQMNSNLLSNALPPSPLSRTTILHRLRSAPLLPRSSFRSIVGILLHALDGEEITWVWCGHLDLCYCGRIWLLGC